MTNSSKILNPFCIARKHLPTFLISNMDMQSIEARFVRELIKTTPFYLFRFFIAIFFLKKKQTYTISSSPYFIWTVLFCISVFSFYFNDKLRKKNHIKKLGFNYNKIMNE